MPLRPTGVPAFLAAHPTGNATLADALKVAANAWAAGHKALSEERETEVVPDDELARHIRAQLASVSIEAVVLEHKSPVAVTYRTLPEAEVRVVLL